MECNQKRSGRSGRGRTHFHSCSPQEKTMREVQLLTVREVCDELRCSVSYVYKLMGSGVLQSVQLGRKRLIDRSEIAKLIDNGGVKGKLFYSSIKAGNDSGKD